MTVQATSQKSGEEFLEHFGKMGMKWGHRSGSSSSSKSGKPHKASPGSRPVSRKRAASYAVAGAMGGGAGALGLLGANKALSRSEAKPKSENAFKRTVKSTALVTAKIGATLVASILPVIGLVAITEIGGPEYRTDNNGETGREWDRQLAADRAKGALV